nr:hypothetical protein [Deltaproteobacteria bacterium]
MEEVVGAEEEAAVVVHVVPAEAAVAVPEREHELQRGALVHEVLRREADVGVAEREAEAEGPGAAHLSVSDGGGGDGEGERGGGGDQETRRFLHRPIL